MPRRSRKKNRRKTKRSPDERAPQLRNLVAKITPSNRHGELQTGPELGRERLVWSR